MATLRPQTRPNFARILLAIAIAALLAIVSRSARAADLVVYTYDSLAAKDGLGPIVAEAFRKKTGIAVKFVVVGDSGQLLSRLQLDLERNKPTAHVVLGMDQNLFPRMRHLLAKLDRGEEAAFMKYVDREWWVDEAFVPYDYGVLAFVADTKKLPVEEFPKRWKDLTKRKFRKSLLLEDPRTSSPGLGFVWGSYHAAAAEAKEGFPPISTTDENPPIPKKTREEFADFWKGLKSQWLTLAPGWSEAYGMFRKGEAPLVWSYVTSEAYHRAKGEGAERERYRAVIFEDGHPVQIEGAGLLKDAPGGAKMRKRAVEFLEALLSEDVQKRVPETQWMMPARMGMKLPPAFQSLPDARKRFNLRITREKLDEALADWAAAIR